MRVAPIPADEDRRLACLTALALLDTPPEAAFERVVRLAQALSGAPIALVSLVDRDRQWFKARRGVNVCETSRDVAFCSHAILGAETLWVEDARADPRFHDNPLVTGEPSIRFYAGAPITLKGGERLGTVCVIGPEPRRYEYALDRALSDLAAVIADDCALRLAKAELAQANAVAAAANQRLNMALDIADLGVWELVYAEKRLTYHRVPKDLFDWRPGFDDIVTDLAMIVHDDDRARVEAAWREHLKTGAPYRCEYRVKRRDGKLVWVFSACELMKDAEGRPERVVGVMHDVTEERAIIDALAAAREAAEAASEAKSAFLADMSHEFRTPLNGVLGLTGALARTPLTPQQAGMVHLIERSGAALEQLLGTVLSSLSTGGFPFAAPAAEVEADPFLDAPPAPVGRRIRVLLAEDHAVNRKVIELILAPLDIDLTMVEDGAEAVEAIRRADFDLILMDIQMPVMDGLTATRRIRELEAGGGKRTPIIAVTANALPAQVAASLEAGVDSHFAKPVTAEALTEAVLAALEEPQAEAAPRRSRA